LKSIFDIVGAKWQADGSLGAFDFFAIIVWKANRAKSKVARRLLSNGRPDETIDAIVRRLTAAVCACATDADRLTTLVFGWRLRLPIATAILSVGWPDRFTVYDVRVCEQLKGFHGLADRTSAERLWAEYVRFCEAVKAAAPPHLSLRDADRYLSSKSFAAQLRTDIAGQFGVQTDRTAPARSVHGAGRKR
jgi:hypothetical protein